MSEHSYTYSLAENDSGTTFSFQGKAMNFAQMLSQIERRHNLDQYRIIEIRELRKRRTRW